MTIAETSWGVLPPEQDADSAPFWAALDQGELRVPSCRTCERRFFPPMPACPRCGSDEVELVRADGRGTVYSWVTVHRALHEAFVDDVPYTILAVDLDGGGRMFGRLIDAETSALSADVPVQLAPYRAGGYVLPGFRIADVD